MEILENVEVEYKTFQAWQTDITSCRDYELLTDNSKQYIEFIENFIQVPSILYIYLCINVIIISKTKLSILSSTIYWRGSK